MSETAVKLPRDYHGPILCRECGTALYFVREILFHPIKTPEIAAMLGESICSLQAKHWKVERPTIDAIECDPIEEPAS